MAKAIRKPTAPRNRGPMAAAAFAVAGILLTGWTAAGAPGACPAPGAAATEEIVEMTPTAETPEMAGKLPPIDAEPPVRWQTATFAMG